MEARENSSAKQLAGSVVVAFAQAARQCDGGLTIATAGRLCHLEQGIGDLGHRADHDNGLFRSPPLDDRRRSVNRLGVLYRGPAKFHNDHGRSTRIEEKRRQKQRPKSLRRRLTGNRESVSPSELKSEETPGIPPRLTPNIPAPSAARHLIAPPRRPRESCYATAP